MKTFKSLILVAFLVIAFSNLVYADGFHEKPRKVFYTTYSVAIQTPGLVRAIQQQVDPAFLLEVEYLYVIQVEYNGAIYKILGSRANWIMFFKMMWIFPPDPNAVRRIN